MRRKSVPFLVVITLACASVVSGQQTLRFEWTQSAAQAKMVPCYSGSTYPACTPAQRSAKAKALGQAATAGMVIKATRTISCGDGSEDPCVANDAGATSIIEKEADASELWRSLTKVEAKKADLLLEFKTTNRESLELCVFDGDSADLLWCETRTVVALDNDASREIVHFLKARQTALGERFGK
jgi:hypothetical protein